MTSEGSKPITGHAVVATKTRTERFFTPTSCFSRGIDMLNGAYHFIDLVPKGRDKDGLEGTQDWVGYHDRYED